MMKTTAVLLRAARQSIHRELYQLENDLRAARMAVAGDRALDAVARDLNEIRRRVRVAHETALRNVDADRETRRTTVQMSGR